MASFTSLSISASWAGVMASKWVKSNRSRSGSTREPAWWTWSPRTFFRAASSRWVALWARMMAFRRSTSMAAVTVSPTLRVPETTLPVCMNLPPLFFWTSVTWNVPLGPWMVPWSPTWPPISA